jgi:hypothetical protein
VGIVLAGFGIYLFYLRSSKPSLSRDKDPFIALIAMLCGGILFFQGWRLDPVLQFGQFLLAGVLIWVSYENIQLRKKVQVSTVDTEKFEPLPYKRNSLNDENKIRRKVDDWDNIIERKRRSVKCSYCGASVDV